MGKLGPGNTNLARNAKWTEIYEELKSKGTVLKDLAHFRKDVWGNIRKAAIAKKDNNNKTGAKAVEITEIDKIALARPTQMALVCRIMPDPSYMMKTSTLMHPLCLQ